MIRGARKKEKPKATKRQLRKSTKRPPQSAILRRLNASLLSRLKPADPPRTPLEFARTLRLPDGPSKGELWVPESEPAQMAVINAIASGRYRRIVVVAPSQRGKTLCAILMPTLYFLTERKVDCAYVLPSLDKLTQAWEGKLKPAIVGTGYGGWLPTKGPGSRGGRGPSIAINNPQRTSAASRLYFMALGLGARETSTAMVSPKVAFLDEGDDAESAGQIELVFRRIESFDDGLGIVASTVNDRDGREDHPILEMLSQGTRTRLWHRCPHCNGLSPTEWEQCTAAGRACPLCGVVLSESERMAALANAVPVHRGDPMDDGHGDTFSILTTGLDYHLGSFARLWRQWEIARDAASKGDESLLKTFTLKVLCRPYESKIGDTPRTNDMALAARATREPYDRGRPHKKCEIVTIGGDTGKREAWWLALGMDRAERWWVLDWSVKTTGDHRAEPSPEDQRTMLDRLHERAARTGRADGMGIDVGYNTDLVSAWAGRNGWRRIRGDQRPTGARLERPTKWLPVWAEERKQTDGTVWLFLDGAAIKHEIAKALAREPGEPGAGHIPAGQDAGDWLIRHLTSEVWDERHRAWVKRPGRDNHLLDCLVYAYALAVIKVRSLPKSDATPLPPPPPRPADTWDANVEW